MSENWRRELERQRRAAEDRIAELEAEIERRDGAEAERRAVLGEETARVQAAHSRIDDVTSGAETAVSGPNDAISEMRAIPLLNQAGDGWNPNAQQALREIIHAHGGVVVDDEPGRWLNSSKVGRDGMEVAVTKPAR